MGGYLLEVAAPPRFLISFEGLADGDPTGAWLASYDVDAHDGFGEATWTRDRAAALVFESSLDALRAWGSQSTIRPLRPDGKPNKPLTAISVMVVPA